MLVWRWRPKCLFRRYRVRIFAELQIIWTKISFSFPQYFHARTRTVSSKRMRSTPSKSVSIYHSWLSFNLIWRRKNSVVEWESSNHLTLNFSSQKRYLRTEKYQWLLWTHPVSGRTIISFFSVALQSLKDLGRLTYWRLLELFRHMVGLLGRVISPSQDLYLHRTTQHRKTRTNIQALSGIRTHDPNRPRPTPQTARPLWPAISFLFTLILCKLMYIKFTHTVYSNLIIMFHELLH
jgi:hypothetical protein